MNKLVHSFSFQLFNHAFLPADLIKSSYSFGQSNTDYTFTGNVFETKFEDLSQIKFTYVCFWPLLQNYSSFLNYSFRFKTSNKTFFCQLNRIKREEIGGSNIVQLKNGSAVDIFVNGNALKPDRLKIIRDKDLIALNDITIAVFVYFDCYDNRQSDHAEELTDKYIICDMIGKGAFGEVLEAFSYIDYKHCAIKVLKIDQQTDSEHLEREAELLRSTKHPNIISVYEVIKRDHAVFIVMEYAEEHLPEVKLDEKVKANLIFTFFEILSFN